MIRFKTRWIVAVLAVAFVTASGALWAVGHELSRPVPAPIGAAPAELQAQPVEFASRSGSMIHGWLSKADAGGGAILLLPGVRANRRSMVGRAQLLHAAGYSTLAIDFQATGESPGDAITFGWRERLDVLAAVDLLRRALPGEPIAIIGTSLGGAATLLAAPELDVQAVVLEAVYPSIDVAVENRLRMRLGAAGAALSPLLVLQLQPRLGIAPSELRPVDRIGLLRCPVLVIGGVEDQHTTVVDTQRLYDAAHEPKQLWLIPDAAHVDFLREQPDAYPKRVLAFLERAFAGAS
jgi:uncharacterized protein